MKGLRIKVGILVIVITLLANAAGKAQTGTSDDLKFKSKSANNAMLFSALGTFIPVVAGVSWWRLDKPKYEVKSLGRGPYGEFYQFNNEEPNRAIPVALILAGLTIGPSLGYFYGGCESRAVIGLSIRIGTGVIVGSTCWALAEHSAGSGLEAAVAGVAIGTAGALIILSDAIYDLAKVKCNVEKNNAKRAQQSSPSVILLPAYFADSGAAGLQLDVNF